MLTGLFLIPLAVLVGNWFGYILCSVWNQTEAKIIYHAYHDVNANDKTKENFRMFCNQIGAKFWEVISHMFGGAFIFC